jgi:hypothetical protein
LRRVADAPRKAAWRSSEVQTSFARAVSQRGDATVVLVAGAVEHDRIDAGRLSPVGQQSADLLGLGGLVAGVGTQVASRVDAYASVRPTESSMI